MSTTTTTTHLTFDGDAAERVADLDRGAGYLRAEIVRYTTTGRVSVKVLRRAAENLEHQARMWRPYLPLLSRHSYTAVLREHPETSVAIATDDPTAALSPAEWRVVYALCEGMTNREVAAALGRSANTIRNHTRSIFDIMGVRTRAELVAKVARLGLLPAHDGASPTPAPRRRNGTRLSRRRPQLHDEGTP